MRKLSILMAMVVLLVSCKDDDGDVQPGATPALPPSSSMSPDFDGLSDDDSGEGGRVHLVRNWIYAATSVNVYSGILSGALVVPVTAFKLAIDQEATFDSENRLWVWEYDASLPEAGAFSVKLTADVDGTSVNWTGYISKTGSFSNFVWFTGESDTEANEGTWTLYESPENPEAWLSSEWSKSELEGIADVVFTVEKEGDGFGSTIGYTASAGAVLNRSVLIVDTNSSNTIDVQWNKEDGFGKIKSEVFFEDTLYHCWDETRNDTDCE